MDTEFMVRAGGAMFAIMNPFVNMPIFLSLTSDNTPGETRAIALQVVLYSAVMCMVFTLGGQAILSFFGISVDDFKLAGGLVLLLLALNMLSGKDSTAHHGTPEEKKSQMKSDNIAFYPLTFPIIVGPGTITTLMVFWGQAETPAQHAGFIVALGSILCLLGVVFFFSSAIGRVLSMTLRVIMTRLMGMILAAISAELITSGLKTLLPGLAGAS